ncbi:TetR family transcriptional regulator C-terminal domain-containing protein [Brachybacterium sp. NPDC056505]|uniref:TetR family transcriptional regulator C-terminal domain-containing protein n=1 Tax=Brachybacterium sp. NPDC056505 TaxID=3345843 RepID=UPI00366DEF3D
MVRFRTAIQGSGLSQREVAWQMRLEETKLSKSLKGARRFQPDELFALATITGVTVSWLLTGSDSDAESAAAPARSALPAWESQAPAASSLRRRRIVQEAWKLFADRGFAQVRISEVAAAAGVSPPTVHYHFEDKEELFAETLRYSVKLAYDRQVAGLESAQPPLDRLRALVRIRLPQQPLVREEWSIWAQTWAISAHSESTRAHHAESYGRWESTVRDIVADGIASGDLREQPLEGAVLRLTALFDGLGIRVLTGLLDPEQMLAMVDAHIDAELAAHP